MGHYDDCYEATRLADESRRKRDLQRWIPDQCENMEVWELEVVYDVVKNVEQYRNLVNLIGRIGDKGGL